MDDQSFRFDEHGLKTAVDLLGKFFNSTDNQPFSLPITFPENGLGEQDTLHQLAPYVVGQATKLGNAITLAHMDPPTPWITWATTMWNAALNQNLLHPATAPIARQIEETVIKWLAPFYGMTGGQMVPGSTIANLTALWAAREARGVKRVVASAQSHISIRKAASILRLEYVPIETDSQHRLNLNNVKNIDDAVLVLTAGTTAIGAIDNLNGATAVPLLATLVAWGRSGIEARINTCMQNAEKLANYIKDDPRFTLFTTPESGVVVWKPSEPNSFKNKEKLSGVVFITKIDNQDWLRYVSANPNADIEKIFKAVTEVFF